MPPGSTSRYATDYPLLSSSNQIQDYGFVAIGGSNGGRHRDISSRSEPVPLKKKKPRPMTPNWSQFMHGGFSLEGQIGPTILPMEYQLPTLHGPPTAKVSQVRSKDNGGTLTENRILKINDGFWGAWILSLAGESSGVLKGSFGRCVVLQTSNGDWIIVEELVQAPDTSSKSDPQPNGRSKLKKKLTGHISSDRRAQESTETKGMTAEQESRVRVERRLRALVLTQKYKAEATKPTITTLNHAPTASPPPVLNTRSQSRRMSSSSQNMNSDIDLALNWARIYDNISSVSTADDCDTHKDKRSYPDDCALDLTCQPRERSDESPMAMAQSYHQSPGQPLEIPTGPPSSAATNATEVASTKLVTNTSTSIQSPKKKKTGFSLLPKAFSKRHVPTRKDSVISQSTSTASSLSTPITESEPQVSVTRKDLLTSPNGSTLHVQEETFLVTDAALHRVTESELLPADVKPTEKEYVSKAGRTARPGIPWDPLPDVPAAYQGDHGTLSASPKAAIRVSRKVVPSGAMHHTETRLPILVAPVAKRPIPTRRVSLSSSCSSDTSDLVPKIVHASTLHVPRERPPSLDSQYSDIARGPSPSPVIARERNSVQSFPSQKARQSLSRRVSDLIEKFELPKRTSSPAVVNLETGKSVESERSMIRDKWHMIREAATLATHHQAAHNHTDRKPSGASDERQEDEVESIYSAESSIDITAEAEEGQYASIVRVTRNDPNMVRPAVTLTSF